MKEYHKKPYCVEGKYETLQEPDANSSKSDHNEKREEICKNLSAEYITAVIANYGRPDYITAVITNYVRPDNVAELIKELSLHPYINEMILFLDDDVIPSQELITKLHEYSNIDPDQIY